MELIVVRPDQGQTRARPGLDWFRFRFRFSHDVGEFGFEKDF